MSSDKIVDAKGLYKSLGDKEILGGLDFYIKKREFIGIIGPSGSGKTTLLSMLAALQYPDKGSINYKNEDLVSLSTQKRAKIRNKDFGYVFQASNMITHMNVLENILMPLYYSEGVLNIREAEAKAIAILSNMELHNYAKKDVQTLSGGESQRIAIARAMINEPEIIFADEPTGSLDSFHTQIVIKELQKIVACNKSVVMVTHDENLLYHCSRVIEIKKL